MIQSSVRWATRDLRAVHPASRAFTLTDRFARCVSDPVRSGHCAEGRWGERVASGGQVALGALSQLRYECACDGVRQSYPGSDRAMSWRSSCPRTTTRPKWRSPMVREPQWSTEIAGARSDPSGLRRFGSSSVALSATSHALPSR